VKDLCELLERFEQRRVALISVAESLDTSSAASRLVLNIMTVVSQWERERRSPKAPKRRVGGSEKSGNQAPTEHDPTVQSSNYEILKSPTSFNSWNDMGRQITLSAESEQDRHHIRGGNPAMADGQDPKRSPRSPKSNRYGRTSQDQSNTRVPSWRMASPTICVAARTMTRLLSR
jgi:hypothetical protein